MLYKEELDKMECAAGHKAKGFWLHSKCHITIPTWVRYEDGIISVRCSVCDKVVAEIAIASNIK